MVPEVANLKSLFEYSVIYPTYYKKTWNVKLGNMPCVFNYKVRIVYHVADSNYKRNEEQVPYFPIISYSTNY